MSIIEREQVEYGAPPVRPPSERKPATVRDVLHRAADLLEEFGWCRVDWGSKERGQFCMHGAMMAAAVDLGVDYGDDKFVDANLRVRGLCGGVLLGWNDAEGRTKEEVVAKLREAAESA